MLLSVTTSLNNPQILLMEKHPAPLRMPKMLVLSQYQDLFEHPEWCRFFFINRMYTVYSSGISIMSCPFNFLEEKLCTIIWQGPCLARSVVALGSNKKSLPEELVSSHQNGRNVSSRHSVYGVVYLHLPPKRKGRQNSSIHWPFGSVKTAS